MTECILSGHAGVSKELLVTERFVLWRLLLEYINLNIIFTENCTHVQWYKSWVSLLYS